MSATCRRRTTRSLPDEDFKIIYEALADKKKRVDEIAQAVKGGAKRLILATDPDREGEAISWHLLRAAQGQRKALKGVDVERVVFHEVTKPRRAARRCATAGASTST